MGTNSLAKARHLALATFVENANEGYFLHIGLELRLDRLPSGVMSSRNWQGITA